VAQHVAEDEDSKIASLTSKWLTVSSTISNDSHPLSLIDIGHFPAFGGHLDIICSRRNCT